jgi:hypothetical protein
MNYSMQRRHQSESTAPLSVVAGLAVDPNLPSTGSAAGLALWGGEPQPFFVYAPALPTPSLDFLFQSSEAASLRVEIAEMRSEIAALTDMAQQIMAQVCRSDLAVQIQEEIDDNEARKRIQQLFDDHPGSLFYDEIAEKLCLPLRQVVEVCNQLETEGLIGEPTER